jgi:3-methylcrotonyl-CoA carboxylase alpha subunit
VREIMPMTRRLQKLLVANRGEIACRIFRTARRMGWRTVAVFSDADRNALHVTLADEAVYIGASPAKDSYLNVDAIIAAARKTGADAVHPGYGFLSENADFAQACVDAGFIFVGPAAKTTRLMGSKSAAKALMEKAGVPTVPGYHGDDQDIATLRKEADRIGYPVLVKASAGGGGRGMRVVGKPDELADAVESAKREAKSAFGDDRMLLEKYLAKARHIEVQVFGDTHGNIVSLFERECTLQRRHQKVIEEAPAVAVAPERRAAMSAAARAAAKAVGYVNAGTVEFIADAAGFYFIEMNTRLQVEHPVTEEITGLDLVEWQLRVASGETLPLGQDDVRAKGHAIEARIYAEDPDKGFLPSIGTIRRWPELPDRDVRVDTGFRAGDAVTPYYDALLAKLIVRGADRGDALERMTAALGKFQVSGVSTNVAFLTALVSDPQVRRGEVDTGFIERELARFTHGAQALSARDIAAACAAVLLREQEEQTAPADGFSPWDRGDGWMMVGRRRRRLSFRHGTERLTATVDYRADGPIMEFADASGRLWFEALGSDAFEVKLGDETEKAHAAWAGRDLELTTPRGRFKLHWIDPFAGQVGAAEAANRIVAPMPGTVTRILAGPGTEVSRGTPLIVMEAMKMEHTLRAPADGRLRALKCAVGDFVQEGMELADFEPADSKTALP